METSEVRKRIRSTFEAAKRTAAARRAKMDDAARDYPAFLESVAAPLFRQAATILKAEGYPFGVFTPAGGVRLMSERSSDDYIELILDTSGETPVVLGRSRRGRGSRIVESEQPIGAGAVREVTEAQVLDFLADALTPFVER
jgi:hypothetical protein